MDTTTPSRPMASDWSFAKLLPLWLLDWDEAPTFGALLLAAFLSNEGAAA